MAANGRRSTPNGTTSQALVAHDLAHVLWAVNLACLGFHVWPSQASDPDHADQLRIDLDPTPGVTFAMVQEAAEEVRRLFEDLGVVALPKTTGNRGIHVFSRLQPRWTSYDVRAAAVAVARELERRRPDLITAGWWKEERGTRSSSTSTKTPRTRRSSAHGRCGRVLVRRSRRRSTGTSWPDCPRRPDDRHRARPGAGPGDPWATMADAPQSLEPVLALHERDMAAGLLDAPWPPVYPKMPGEPPRVAPSRAKKPKV